MPPRKKKLGNIAKAALVGGIGAGVLGTVALGYGTTKALTTKPKRPAGVPERTGGMSIRGARGDHEPGVPREQKGGLPTPAERIGRAVKHKDPDLLKLHWPDKPAPIAGLGDWRQTKPFHPDRNHMTDFRPVSNGVAGQLWRQRFVAPGHIQEALGTPLTHAQVHERWSLGYPTPPAL